ncbi:Ca-activated chloride channel homolog [Gammaproteobacteria bacterium]
MHEMAFHFSNPDWFWALWAVIPVALWLRWARVRSRQGPIHRYADPHLLPYLTGMRELHRGEQWSRLGRWAGLWLLAVTAMAGPRWDYTDVGLLRASHHLLVLFDISRSMLVRDVEPSRLARARQEVADLLTEGQGLRIGLIAFASIPVVVSPMTEDTQSLRNLLTVLDADLVTLQGSRLLAALERAEALLIGLPPESPRHLVLVSDGDFDEPDILVRVRSLAEKGIHVHTLGVGTRGGGPVPSPYGQFLMDRTGHAVESRLGETQLRQIAEAGRGVYAESTFLDTDTRAILKAVNANYSKPPTESEDRTLVWNERFYLVLIPLMLILLPLFRRGGLSW